MINSNYPHVKRRLTDMITQIRQWSDTKVSSHSQITVMMADNDQTLYGDSHSRITETAIKH